MPQSAPSAASGVQKTKAQLKAERRLAQKAKAAQTASQKDSSEQQKNKREQTVQQPTSPSDSEPVKTPKTPVEDNKKQIKTAPQKEESNVSTSEKPEGESKPEESQKSKAELKAERKKAFEAQRAAITDGKKNEEAGATQKSKAQLKAERRALQEAQRAIKDASGTAKHQGEKTEALPSKAGGEGDKNKIIEKSSKKLLGIPAKVTSDKAKENIRSSESPKKVTKKVSAVSEHKREFHLFSHLKQKSDSLNHLKDCGSTKSAIHPAVLKIGLQIAQGVITGSNARCISMLYAFCYMLKDYISLSQKRLSQDLTSSLERHTEFLNRCRPLSVSMQNAVTYLKGHITNLPECKDIQEVKDDLVKVVKQFVYEEIILAKRQISKFAQDKILDKDVILVYSGSSLVKEVLIQAHKSGKDFRVVVADSRPKLEGREMLRRLVKAGIHCSYIFINSVSYIMKEVTKVMLGAHSLQANGSVMSRIGSSQIALVAHSCNVPVLVCCETYKFSERVNTDSFVFNELGSTSELVSSQTLNDLKDITTLTLLNLTYDVTPPQFVAMVITEKGMLPCTSVPVVLRMRSAGMQQ